MIKTLTAPVDDPKMWRKARRPHHPDNGGDAEVFIFLTAVMERVSALKATREAPREETVGDARRSGREAASTDRIPYPPGSDFREITRTALRYACTHPGTFAGLLRRLADCETLVGMERQQSRGASYRQLAYVGHLVGMSKPERVVWYRLAEDLVLTDRHCSHIISRLQKEAA